MLRTWLKHRAAHVAARKWVVAAGLLATAALAGAGLAGCAPTYEQQRPPMDQLDPRDSGLQSKDVLQASDKLAMDLLALPELNDSRTQWTIVFDHVDDNTNSRMFAGNFDVFLQRLRNNLARQGRGRIRIIANRDTFYKLRDRELERGPADEFGQGSPGQGTGAPAARDPDFALRGVAMDLPNRGTVYYNLQFQLVNLRTREEVWTNQYEVRTSR
jgi:hypothetical protein